MCEASRDYAEMLKMSDYIWTSVICLMLIAYLLYSLLKPEKF